MNPIFGVSIFIGDAIDVIGEEFREQRFAGLDDIEVERLADGIDGIDRDQFVSARYRRGESEGVAGVDCHAIESGGSCIENIPIEGHGSAGLDDIVRDRKVVDEGKVGDLNEELGGGGESVDIGGGKGLSCGGRRSGCEGDRSLSGAGVGKDIADALVD